MRTVKPALVTSLFVAVLCLVAFNGCASVPAANRHGWTLIESDPAGAKIEINNRYVGITPLRVDLPLISENLSTPPVAITAYSPTSGAMQTQFVSPPTLTPFRIFFDLKPEATKRNGSVQKKS